MPGVGILYANVSEHLFHLHRQVGMKMEHTECSETSAYKIQTPGNYPEDSINIKLYYVSLDYVKPGLGLRNTDFVVN